MEARESDLDHLRWLELLDFGGFKGRRVLDLGCGSGYLPYAAASQGAQSATGLDIILPPVDLTLPGLKIYTANLDSPDWAATLPSGNFDLVFAFDIIEHLESPFRFLASALSLMADGGKLILTTPNAMSWERFVRPLSWSGASDPQHKTLFSSYTLNFLLKRVGFRAAEIQAPMRSLTRLGGLIPDIGGQLLCSAEK